MNRSGIRPFSTIIVWASLMLASSAWSASKGPVLEQQSVGKLPYSNQWLFETREAYFYMTMSTLGLENKNIDFTNYTSEFEGSPLQVYALDYFKHLKRFGSLESNSKLKDFSLWGRYSIGINTRTGHLRSKSFTINSSVESSTLMTVIMHLGPNITYERWKWVQPYLGFDVSPYFYRHSASLSGAESQGKGIMYGPVLGAHFPVLFDQKLSFLMEVKDTIKGNNKDNTYASGLGYLAGLGLVF